MEDLLFYNELAPFYDKIYHYVDYENQARYFAKLMKEYGTTENVEVLDVCCGTGTHSYFLNRMGLNVTGLDLSSEMLKIARAKNPDLNFVQADMRNFRLDKKFDAILCCFNAILYNKNRNELTAFLQNANRHLAQGGLLIFDAVDKRIGKRPNKKTYAYQEHGLKAVFEPEWVLNEKKGILDLFIRFSINGKTHKDYHPMGAFSLKELETLLSQNGFEVFRFSSRFDNPQTEEALFVGRKTKEA